MPRIDHAALWVSDLAGARDFYVGWFAGRSNGEYHNPATGLRTFIITFEPDDAGEASNGPVVDGPRRTGDGYYEAVLLDPEGNRVEIVAGDYTDEIALRPEA